MMVETRIIGQDTWWDHGKREFRKKRLNLEKIPLRFRCPLCGISVVPISERKKNRHETSDHWKIESHNRKVLGAYFKRDRPLQEEFKAWHDRILMEHSDEFKDHVYVESYEDPPMLSLNKAFYGRYVCNKCLKNYPRQQILKRDSIKTEAGSKPKKKIGIWINGYYKLVNEVIEIVHFNGGKEE